MKPLIPVTLVLLVTGMVTSSYGGNLTMRPKTAGSLSTTPAKVIRLGDAKDQAAVVSAFIAEVNYVADAATKVGSAFVAGVAAGWKAADASHTGKQPAPAVMLSSAHVDVLFDDIGQR